VSKNLDDLYYKILLKCESSPENANVILESGSIRGLIVEKLDKEDIAAVTKSLSKTKKSIDAISNYANKLQLQNELKPMYDYLDALSAALEKTEKELAGVRFESGVLSSFFGKNVSLPQITSAAVKLATKAVDFGRGFQEALESIRTGLVPLLKDADKTATLSDALASDPDLDVEKISRGIKDTLKKEMGGTLFKKVGSFFTKALTGKEYDIMKSTPGLDVDMADMAEKIGTELVNAKIENLLGNAPPPPPPADNITDLADEMQDAAEHQQQETGEETPEGGEGGPPEDPETVDDNLEDAVRDAKENSESPLDGALDAIDGWVDSLSSSSQKTIKGAGRLGNLKDAIRTKLDDSASAVESAVESAISDWVAENEETLVKSKRFAKKNFDSLKSLVPQLAAFMLKQTNESSYVMTEESVRKFVVLYMNKVYKNTNHLNESKSVKRWQKIAGIL
tara:strand:+ start:366 stop:1721 length:1356 start_codon:yes stop_codon:yes gene_type:complete